MLVNIRKPQPAAASLTGSNVRFASLSYQLLCLLLLSGILVAPLAAFSQTTNIALIGDSITHAGDNEPGYRRALWKKLQSAGYNVDFVGSQNTFFGNAPPTSEQDFDLDHEGHWAKEAGYVAENIDDWLIGYTPDIAVIHLGTNDFDRDQSNDSTLEEFESIFASLRADNPNVTILIAEIIPMRDKDTAPLNEAIRTWAPSQSTSRSRVIVVDQYTGYEPSVDSYDNFHPNATGQEKMADRWFVSLQSILRPGNETTLIGSWLFDEGTGSQATDRSSLNNVGMLSGHIWEQRNTGSSICFDGSESQQMATANESVPNPSALTIAAWVKVDPQSTDWGWVGGFGDSTGLHVNIANQGGLTFYIYEDDMNWPFATVSGASLGLGSQGLKDGLWHHVAGSYDPATGFKLYVDGQLKTSKAETSPINYSLGGNFVAGARIKIGSATSDRNLFGCLDELTLFDAALSDADIFNLANSINPPPEPETVTYAIATGNDDAEERADRSMYLNSSDIELTQDSSQQTVGLRFTNIDVPPGAIINNAYLQFTVDETGSGTSSLTIHGQNAANPGTFTRATANISNRPTTNASVNWSPPEWNTVKQSASAQRTPNLAAIVQEIIDNNAWNSGQAIAFIISGDGERTAESYEGDDQDAATLHIEFSSDGNRPPSATILATPTQGDLPLPVSFDASGSTDDGGIVRYDWVFGDGQTQSTNGPTVSHTYSTPGSFSATVTVSDASAKSDSASIDISVSQATVPTLANITINEFLAKNDSGLTDETDSREDWIELYNNDNSPASLVGWCLRDSEDEWCFPDSPDASIPANGFIVVFASKNDLATAPFHTNFKLAKEGEYLGLFAPDNPIAVHEYAAYPPQNDDQSYGVALNGELAFFATPTPNAPNSPDTNLPPNARVSADETRGTATLTVMFDATDSTDDGTIVSYDWDFGDGNTLSDSTPQVSHDYDSTGTFIATLTVTDDQGKSDSTTISIIVEDATTPVLSTVVINEFLASNKNDLTDNTGAAEVDWIELHNSSDFAVDLSGWCLTDNENTIDKWCFPNSSDATIAANGFLVLFASDETDRTDGAAFHTNFKLGKGGEYLGLFKSDQSLAFEYVPEYPQQFDDVSYGLDASGTATYFSITTPGASNDTAEGLTPLKIDAIADITLFAGTTRTVNITTSGGQSSAVVFDESALPDFASLTNNTDGTATLLLQPTVAGTSEIDIVATDGRFEDSVTFNLNAETENGIVNSVNDLELTWGTHPLIADIVGSRLFISLNSDFSTPSTLSEAFSYRNSLSGYGVLIDGTALSPGDLLTRELSHGDTFTLELTKNNSIYESYTLVVTNLALVEITADTIVDEPKSPGMIRIVDGPLGIDSGWQHLGIEFRGATAQAFAKKPYGIELRDADGEELDMPLLGLRDNDGDWILDAAYRDQSFVRNIVSHDLYRLMRTYAYIDETGTKQGQSTIAGDAVEVIVNGSYEGVHILSERIDRKLLGLSKIEVPENESGERWDQVNFDDPENGTLIFKANRKHASFYDTRAVRDAWVQEYPKFEDTDRLDVLEETHNFVLNSTTDLFVANIENYFDLSSLVDFYLLRMFAGNVDSFTKNYYLVRNKHQKWFFVPWDYDATYGISWDGSFREDSLEFNWPSQNLLVCRLIKNPEIGFNEMVKARWDTLRLSLYTTDIAVAKFRGYLDRIGVNGSSNAENAYSRNLQRWPNTGNIGSGTPELGQLTFIQQWLADRLVKLDALYDDLPTTGPGDSDPTACDRNIREPLR